MLFFRDQDITTEQHLAFARRFGALEEHPFAPHKPDYPEVLAITHDRDSRGKENTWHSDVTWREAPSLGSILRAIELPPVGGDTLFADMARAYDGLSDAIKEEIEGKPSRCTTSPTSASACASAARARRRSRHSTSAIPWSSTPWRAPIPRPASARSMSTPPSPSISSGLSPERSRELLAHLYAQAAIPEYQCRFRWEANSIAFWDNRSSQHYAASDYWPAVRRMERVTVVGSRPV